MGLGFALFEDRILDRNTGADGEPEHGVVPPAGHVRHSRDRHHARRPARARRRSASASRRRSRRPRRSPTRSPTPSACACAACRSRPTRCSHALRAGEGRRHAVKAFAYVNAANEKEAIAGLVPERGKVLPLAGGMDLLALMKDYVAQPERARQRQGRSIGAIAMTRGRRPAHRRRGHARGARRARRRRGAPTRRSPTAAERSRHAADPQRRHRRRQHACSARAAGTSATRSSHCLKKGGRAVLRRGRREPVPRHLRRRPVPHRPPVEPGGAGRRLRRALPRRRARRASARSPPTSSS